MDLLIEDPQAVDWIPGAGLAVERATILQTSGPAARLIEACRTSGEITIELWITPAAVRKHGEKGPNRILTVSGGSDERNVTIGDQYVQDVNFYETRLRTTATNRNGLPSRISEVGAVAAERTHVVFTRAADGRESFYLNGRDRPADLWRRKVEDANPEPVGGDLSNWDQRFRLALANEIPKGKRPWLGTYHRVAIYARALSAEEVRGLYARGTE